MKKNFRHWIQKYIYFMLGIFVAGVGTIFAQVVNFANVEDLEKKITGGVVTAKEFNDIVDALRGIYTDFDKGIMKIGRANKPIDLKVNGSLELCDRKGENCVMAGAGGKIKNITKQSYNGSVGSYVGANAICGLGAHVCTTEEILNTINNFPREIPLSGVGWINGGAPGHQDVRANDCEGWSTNTSDAFGRYWEFTSVGGRATGGASWIDPCNLSHPFLCCK